jgi:hypothetical protein
VINFDDYSKVDQAFFFQGAPFSSDGSAVAPVPEPGTIALEVLGLLGLFISYKRRGRVEWK